MFRVHNLHHIPPESLNWRLTLSTHFLFGVLTEAEFSRAHSFFKLVGNF